MKGKHAKDTANKLKLAKRTLALCFAVVFLCSCMLPVFATGSSLTDVLREAVEETAASAADTTESSGGTMMDSFQSYYASYTAEYKTTYRFWLSEKDSYNLPDTATTAASDLEQYDDFYKVVTIKENTTLTAPDGFKNPTDPTGEGRKFEGWYYYSAYGSPEDFAFDGSSVILDKSSTIDVFAKWGEAPVEEPAEDGDKTTDDTKADDTVKDDTKADDTTTDDDTVSDDDDVTEDDGEETVTGAKASLVSDMADYAAATQAQSYTIDIGTTDTTVSLTCSQHNSRTYYQWVSDDESVATVEVNDWDSSKATVTGVAVGTTTIRCQYWYRDRGSWKWVDHATFDVEVKDSSDTGKVKVYVYVAAYDRDTHIRYSDEMLKDLLHIDPETLDGNNYFPAGVIELDKSYFNGKTGANTPGKALINSSADWLKLRNALDNMDPTMTADSQPTANSSKVVDYTKNNNNLVGAYLDQAEGDIDETWGSQSTALFRWHITAKWNTTSQHYGFKDQSVKYHLDLRFTTKKITFITGNNGITTDISKDAYDGKVVDSRVYIKGSEIQPPRDLKVPDGYQLVGYYEDKEMTKPWNGIGTPLNDDETVYIKIAKLDDVILRYKVAEGEGTVTPDSEALNPVTGVAQGSTATPDSGWSFAGWFYDEACTKPVPASEVNSNNKFTPTRPDGGWVNGTTYWAKFTQNTQNFTIWKKVTGNIGDLSQEFNFKITVKLNDEEAKFKLDGKECTGSETFTLKNGKYVNLTDVPVNATVTIEEIEADGYTVTADLNGTEVGSKQTDGGTFSFKVGSAGIATQSLDGADDGLMLLAETEDGTPVGGDKITITNTMDIEPPTGVILDTLPYILMLAAVGGGAIAFFLRKRHHDDED